MYRTVGSVAVCINECIYKFEDADAVGFNLVSLDYEAPQGRINYVTRGPGIADVSATEDGIQTGACSRAVCVNWPKLNTFQKRRKSKTLLRLPHLPSLQPPVSNVAALIHCLHPSLETHSSLAIPSPVPASTSPVQTTPHTMLSSSPKLGGQGGEPAPAERLPNFLLSSSAAPGSSVRSPPSQFPFTPSRTPTRDFAPRSAGKPPAGDMTTPPWTFQRRRQGQTVAFNDRLRTPDSAPGPADPAAAAAGLATPDSHFSIKTRRGSAIGMEPSPTGSLRTPSRMPPNKSLLDSGPPSVLSLRSPSPSPAHQPITPASLAYRTPGSASPAVPGLERWVTVFGFSPAMESQVLREFRRHGEIVRTVAGKGNWVHVLYRTPLQAQVALYKPWRILAGSETMVGTVVCTEPHVAKEQEENIERGMMLASPAGKTPTDAMAGVRSPSQPHSALRTPASLLRRDHAMPTGSARSIVRTPQKQTGFLDYLSGLYK